MNNRTTYCGLITSDFLDQEVTVKGWVQKRRDLGGLIFIDLRDRKGIVEEKVCFLLKKINST